MSGKLEMRFTDESNPYQSEIEVSISPAGGGAKEFVLAMVGLLGLIGFQRETIDDAITELADEIDERDNWCLPDNGPSPAEERYFGAGDTRPEKLTGVGPFDNDGPVLESIQLQRDLTPEEIARAYEPAKTLGHEADVTPSGN